MMEKDATVSSRRVSTSLFTILQTTREKAVCAKLLIELRVKVHEKNAHVAGKKVSGKPRGKESQSTQFLKNWHERKQKNGMPRQVGGKEAASNTGESCDMGK